MFFTFNSLTNSSLHVQDRQNKLGDRLLKVNPFPTATATIDH